MFWPPPLPITGSTRKSSPSSSTADMSYAIVTYVALRLPEMTAMVFALTRSPTGPSCGLFGTADPERFCAAAGCARNAANAATRQKNSTHGRDRDLPPPTMTLSPCGGVTPTQHTRNALRKPA